MINFLIGWSAAFAFFAGTERRFGWSAIFIGLCIYAINSGPNR